MNSAPASPEARRDSRQRRSCCCSYDASILPADPSRADWTAPAVDLLHQGALAGTSMRRPGSTATKRRRTAAIAVEGREARSGGAGEGDARELRYGAEQTARGHSQSPRKIADDSLQPERPSSRPRPASLSASWSIARAEPDDTLNCVEGRCLEGEGDERHASPVERRRSYRLRASRRKVSWPREEPRSSAGLVRRGSGERSAGPAATTGSGPGDEKQKTCDAGPTIVPTLSTLAAGVGGVSPSLSCARDGTIAAWAGRATREAIEDRPARVKTTRTGASTNMQSELAASVSPRPSSAAASTRSRRPDRRGRRARERAAAPGET